MWQTDDAHAFAAANFRQVASATCGIARVNELTVGIQLNRAMTGGGIFNMDGALLAVILPCGDHLAAIEPSSVDDVLRCMATIEERLLARYGLLFTGFSEEEPRYFSGTDGLLLK